jgi:hypothetical protein
MTDDPALAPVLQGAAGVLHHLVLVVGPAANGMIVSSRQRLLAYMRAGGDADGAALEMERHLSGLHFMWRLIRSRREAGYDARPVAGCSTTADPRGPCLARASAAAP